MNLSAASPKKIRTRAVRLIGSVGVPAYEVQCAWLAKTVDCVVNGKAQETPSQGWKTFLRNHAEGIASIGLFVLRLRRHSRLLRDLEAVAIPTTRTMPKPNDFPKFLLNDTVAPAERVIPALASGSVCRRPPTDWQSKLLVWPEICVFTEASRRKLACPTPMSSKFPAVLRELSPATPKIK